MATFRRGPGGAPEAIETPEDQSQEGWVGGHPLPTILCANARQRPQGIAMAPGGGGSWGSLKAGPIPGREGGGRQPPSGRMKAIQAPGPPGARLVSRVEVIRADHWVTAQMHPCRHPPSDQGSPRHPEAPDHHEVDTPPFGPNPTNSPNGHPRPAAPTIRPRRSRFVHPPGPDPRRGASKLTPLALRLGLRC